MPKADSGKSTQSFIGKLLTFSGNKIEDRKKIADNWPFPAPPLNCAEDMERHRRGERARKMVNIIRKANTPLRGQNH